MSGALFPVSGLDVIRAGRRDGARHLLDMGAWARLVDATGPERPAAPAFLGLWGDAAGGVGHVHALFRESGGRALVASVATEGGRYLGLSSRHPLAVPYERLVRDLFGYEAMHAADLRPLIDHGAWTATAPRAARPGPPPRRAEPPEWRVPPTADGAIDRGPVHGRPPTNLRERATLAGDRAVAIELSFGHGHRGVLAHLVGLPLHAAAAGVGRIDCAASVAHETAFARAAEQALDVEPPPRALLLRDLAAALTRAASHLDVLSDLARAADATRLARETARLLAVLRPLLAIAFGHRYGRGHVVPGGVSHDLDSPRLEAVAQAASLLAEASGRLHAASTEAGGLAFALGDPAAVSAAEALRVGAGGVAGLASGLPCAAADAPAPGTAGTAIERTRLRIDWLGRAGAVARRILAELIDRAGEAVRTPFGPPGETGPRDGIGAAIAAEGEVWHVLRLGPDGTVADLFVRDPAIANLLLLEGRTRMRIEDIALARLSFGLAAAGLDQ